MRRIHLLAMLLGLALAVSPIVPAHAASNHFSWSGAVDPKGGLTVRIHEGDVTIRPASGREASVTARLHGRRAEVEKVELETTEDGSAVEIAAEYPPRRNRDEPITRVRIDVEIAIPSGVKVVARTEKGSVTALGLDGPVDASTAVGDIEISTRAWARARSVNGDVRVQMGSTDWTGELRFETVNGDVDVSVPEAVDSQVSVLTRNGHFTTDLFPTERRSAIPGARISGKVGHGGNRELHLETVNGDIRLGST